MTFKSIGERRLRMGLILGVLGLVAGCTTSPPENTENICEIFREKGGWYHDANKASKRWGTPIPVMMSFIYQESSFVANAKPPRTKLLWIIPWRRPASAKGYSQAINETWDSYKKSTGRWGADRNDFDDAIDFTGWYIDQSYRRNGIRKGDAYSQYLAYHEGHGGFARRTFEGKAWLKRAAGNVSSRSQRYTSQLASCEKEFQRPWFIRILPFF